MLQKIPGSKGKAHWIGKITEEDINKLPLILLGLNYQKYFPREIPKSTFTKSFQKANPGMAFFTSMFSNKTLASGIKEMDNNYDLINVVNYKLTEYNELKEDSKEFSQPPVKVEVLHPDDSNSTEENIIHEVTSTDLNQIEKIIRNESPSEIITITDGEDIQNLDHDHEIDNLDQAISQDLEATINLINMIKFDDKVHEGKDEATISLVSRLEAEAKAEEAQYNKQRDEQVKTKVTKNTKNFPSLDQPKKQ